MVFLANSNIFVINVCLFLIKRESVYWLSNKQKKWYNISNKNKYLIRTSRLPLGKLQDILQITLWSTLLTLKKGLSPVWNTEALLHLTITTLFRARGERYLPQSLGKSGIRKNVIIHGNRIYGNPLQYSCLENPTDRGAWRALDHGVAESDMTEWLTHIEYGMRKTGWGWHLHSYKKCYEITDDWEGQDLCLSLIWKRTSRVYFFPSTILTSGVNPFSKWKKKSHA